MNSVRELDSSWGISRLHGRIIIAASIFVLFFAAAGASWAQGKQPVHLNPIIDKLAAGKTVYGITTGDFSIDSAEAASRAPVDFVYLDMEHHPMDLTAVYTFLVGMSDRGRVYRKGNLQPDVALLARFPMDADESGWVVQQVLDFGMHGFIFNGVRNKEQAELAVKSMTYEPVGNRGSGAGLASRIWGIGGDEYMKHAQLWPLHPEGDLLCMLMIETAEGAKNADAIMSTPGVGAVFVGAGGDMHVSMQVPANSPAVEANFQLVLKACKAHNIACAITASTPDDVAKRVREGWRIIRTTSASAVAGRKILGEPEPQRGGGGGGEN